MQCAQDIKDLMVKLTRYMAYVRLYTHLRWSGYSHSQDRECKDRRLHPTVTPLTSALASPLGAVQRDSPIEGFAAASAYKRGFQVGTDDTAANFLLLNKCNYRYVFWPCDSENRSKGASIE